MKIIVIAVDIRSTHNVGSLLRTCDGFGVLELWTTGLTPHMDSSRQLPHISEAHRKAIHKVALGAETSVPICVFDDAQEALHAAKNNGYTLIALEQDERSISLRDFDSNSDTIALVLGPEVTGLSKDILDQCDTIVEIPMRGIKESFNVSVACGIALYALSR